MRIKRTRLVFALFLSAILINGCTTMSDYSPYYDAYGMKGTEIYCWQIKKNVWRCGAMIGTNRIKTLDEIKFMQDDLPCELQTMKRVISTFPEENSYIILVIPYPMTKEIYETYDYNTYISSDSIYHLSCVLGI